MGNTPAPPTRLQLAVPILLAAAIVVGLAWHLVRERSDEDEVLWLTYRLTHAWTSGDFETIWDLSSVFAREELGTLKSPPETPEEQLETWQWITDATGVPVADLAEMDAEEFYVALQEARVAAHPEEWQRQIDALRSLVVEGVRVDEDPIGSDSPGLKVRFVRNAGDKHTVSYHFVKEEGEWRFHGASQFADMEFLFLERELAVFLPTGDPQRTGHPVDAIVEVGRDGIDEAEYARLGEWLTAVEKSAPDGLSVLLEVSAGLTISEALVALDAVTFAKIETWWFADTTETGRPPPGIRVNGVALEDLGELPPVPTDHPALGRIIRIRGE